MLYAAMKRILPQEISTTLMPQVVLTIAAFSETFAVYCRRTFLVCKGWLFLTTVVGPSLSMVGHLMSIVGLLLSVVEPLQMSHFRATSCFMYHMIGDTQRCRKCVSPMEYDVSVLEGWTITFKAPSDVFRLLSRPLCGFPVCSNKHLKILPTWHIFHSSF